MSGRRRPLSRQPGTGRRTRLGAASRGQALIEFAFVVPVIVFLVAAFIEGGRAVYSYTTVADAARQGARVAAVNQLTTFADCDETLPIEDPNNAHWTIVGCVIQAGVGLGLQPGNVSISYAAPPDTTLSCSPTIHIGCLASVTVTYSYRPSTPLVSGVIPAVTMTSTSEMPVERVFP